MLSLCNNWEFVPNWFEGFETGEGQANVSEKGMMRCWIPVDGYEDVLLHLSFKSP